MDSHGLGVPACTKKNHAKRMMTEGALQSATACRNDTMCVDHISTYNNYMYIHAIACQSSRVGEYTYKHTERVIEIRMPHEESIQLIELH